MDRFLTLRQVCEHVGVGQSTVRVWVAQQCFPQPRHPFRDLPVGASSQRWIGSEVEAWIEARKELAKSA